MNYETIPTRLRRRTQWVCWKYVSRPGASKPAKVPCIPSTGHPANITDDTTWESFDIAYRHYHLERYDGLGFVLTQADDIVGIDIDNCVAPDGKLLQPAQSVIPLLESYTEYSPSGRGIRIFVMAVLGTFSGRRKGRLELYNYNRYLTVTGNHLPGTPPTLQSRLTELRQLYRVYLCGNRTAAKPKNPPQIYTRTPTDNAVIQRMFQGKLGHLYQQIYHNDISWVYGRNTPDESRADTLLMNALAFYTYRNANQMKRILLASPRAMHRLSKWMKVVREGQTYLDYQIADSIRYTKQYWSDLE